MASIVENSGDLLGVSRGVIVHGCNAQGVMNSGVAKAVRRMYPEAFNVYRDAFRNGVLTLGSVVPYSVNDDLVIANAVTQKHYGYDGNQYVDYDAIARAFMEVFSWQGIQEVHFPLIGCGLGGGEWAIVSDKILTCALCSGYEGTLNLWKLEE